MNIKIFLLAAGLTLCPAQAWANDLSGAYVNLGLTQISADLDLSDVNIQGTPVNFGEQSADITMITGRVGYRLMDYLALEAEGGFSLGGDSFSQVVPVNVSGLGTVNVDTDVDLDVTSYAGAFIRGIVPLGDQFEIFGRVGYGTASAKADAVGTTDLLGGISAGASESASTDDFAYGVGAQFNFNERTGLRLDYSTIGGDADVISAAVAFRF